MDIINILPDSVANQIAAGEVVDRPAGAVKELLENAMDAGATHIDLIVKDAGRTLIQVIDNGSGMSDSDARLCFERHATSKIHRSDDLFAIHTMGFRGEALASIAAIAQVELRTRLHDSELGTTVQIEGSQIVDQQLTACQPGTSISVKNLFFNVPARRNFLKKDSVELSHIEEVFKRIVLVHYDIGFTFVSNGKTLYDLRPGTMLQRIAGIYGNHYKERFYEVQEETDLVKISGFVGKPEYSRRTRGEQYLFVNGRYIKHPALSAAVEKAYDEMLPERSYPSYYIALQVDPSRIDVNIHPTKTEVKFVDDHALFAILRSAVKKSLGVFTLANQLSFDTPDEFNIGPAPTGYTPPAPSVSYNPNYNPFKASASQSHMDFKQPDIPVHADIPDYTEGADFQDEADVQEPQQPQSSACLQLQGRFIVTALSSGLAIIDQQRAHERVIYERLTKAEGQVPSSQTLLFPVSCQFTVADAELFGELLPDLRGYGFEVEPAGQATFVVTATPSDLKESDLQPLFDQMLAEYKGAAMQKFSNRSHSLCASLARQMAVKSGKVLSQEEMQQLVADLFACPMADTSPSGKKIITIVNPEDILK
ncbi:MAG: DNA mismatch repair endonuclease MutL [Bacteroidales bacterium]|nr:DNA mismatch repair endonuclease MutL [Bacteroidales bacterium]